MMENYVKFDYLDTAISNGELEAIAITAMSYASGQSVTFYQGQEQNSMPGIDPVAAVRHIPSDH